MRIPPPYTQNRDRRPRCVRWAEQLFRKGFRLIIDTDYMLARFERIVPWGQTRCSYEIAQRIRDEMWADYPDRIVVKHTETAGTAPAEEKLMDPSVTPSIGTPPVVLTKNEYSTRELAALCGVNGQRLSMLHRKTDSRRGRDEARRRTVRFIRTNSRLVDALAGYGIQVTLSPDLTPEPAAPEPSPDELPVNGSVAVAEIPGIPPVTDTMAESIEVESYVEAGKRLARSHVDLAIGFLYGRRGQNTDEVLAAEEAVEREIRRLKRRADELHHVLLRSRRLRTMTAGCPVA